ncbi:MAG: ATP-binding cassette domain-containing protein [Butyricicoccus pullicaecorum]|nr:ATP-binding cassette domain-containing protein [Butyricicoccus pullicaecorum]
MSTITLKSVTKEYDTGSRTKKKTPPAVQDIDLTIEQGEFVFVLGSSGAGKSTLLHLMAGDIAPTIGHVFLDDIDLAKVPERKRPQIRRRYGVVWQDPKLIEDRTIFENIAITMRAAGMRRKEIQEAVPKALGIVGLRKTLDSFPHEISGGERMRIELARAIVNSPDILIVDEPTANLDNDTAWDMIQLFQEINRRGTTIVMATHAKSFVNILRKRVVTLADGKVIGDVKNGRYGYISHRFSRAYTPGKLFRNR